MDAVHLVAYDGNLPLFEELVGADPALVHKRVPEDGPQELVDGAFD